jgi:hypothetical protein
MRASAKDCSQTLANRLLQWFMMSFRNLNCFALLLKKKKSQISKLMNAIERGEADQPGFHLLCSGQVITGDKVLPLEPAGWQSSST